MTGHTKPQSSISERRFAGGHTDPQVAENCWLQLAAKSAMLFPLICTSSLFDNSK
jgi:hypothetical protein